MSLFAIDPGNRESAYVVLADDYRPLHFGKLPNDELEANIASSYTFDDAVIEMVASYGMAVGADVFETCVQIGRFQHLIAGMTDFEPRLIKRLPVKVHHCKSAKAKDSNVRQALVDRFAPGEPNYGKGTKAAPGWFHGFHSDVWAAYALAVYALDKQRGQEVPF